MAISIEHLRVTWIRALSLPSLVGATGLPGPNVGTLSGYFQAYDAAAGPGARWRRPWDGDASYSKLWRRNLRRAAYDAADAGAAWQRMVPLRSAPASAIGWSGPAQAAVTADRYLFPGAIAIVLTADMTGSLDFPAALRNVALANGDEAYELDGSSGLRLAQVYDRLFRECQQEIIGGQDPDAAGDPDPLTIVSVLAADGPAQDAAVAQDNAVHRLLLGFCTLDPAALDHPVSGPLERIALTQSARAGDATLLAWHRRRAHWSPAKMFSEPSQYKLLCYCHNLTVSSAMTEALLAFIADDRARLKGQPGFDISKIAANVLGMLYGPAADMWSSMSIRDQIDSSGAVPVINDVRQQHGWRELSARTPT